MTAVLAGRAPDVLEHKPAPHPARGLNIILHIGVAGRGLLRGESERSARAATGLTTARGRRRARPRYCDNPACSTRQAWCVRPSTPLPVRADYSGQTVISSVDADHQL